MTMKYWSIEEYDTLRQMANRHEPLNDLMHLLPGRTLTSAKKAIGRLGLKKNTKSRDGHFAAVLKALKRRSMFSSEIAKRLSLSRTCTDLCLKRLHEAKKIHISDRVITGEYNRTRLWTIGEGEDMPLVSKKRKSVSKKRQRKEEIKEPEKKITQVIVRRDDFTAAFFGSAEAA